MGYYFNLQGKIFGLDYHQISLAGSWDTPVRTWNTLVSRGTKHNG